MSAIEAKYLIEMNKKLNAIKEILSEQIQYNDWYDIKRFVQKGIGSDLFPVGSILTVDNANVGSIQFVVADHDSSNYDYGGRHVMTLISKNAYTAKFPQSYPYYFGEYYQETTNMALEVKSRIGNWASGYYYFANSSGGGSNLFIKTDINSSLDGAETYSESIGGSGSSGKIERISDIDNPPVSDEYIIGLTTLEANRISFGHTTRLDDNFFRFMNNTADDDLSNHILNSNPYFALDGITSFYKGFGEDFRSVVSGRTEDEKFFLPSFYEINANYKKTGIAPLKLAETSKDKYIRLTDLYGNFTSFATETVNDDGVKMLVGGYNSIVYSYPKNNYNYCIMCNIVG